MSSSKSKSEDLALTRAQELAEARANAEEGTQPSTIDESRTPPLGRPESALPPIQPPADLPPELVQPDLTQTGVKVLAQEAAAVQSDLREVKAEGKGDRTFLTGRSPTDLESLSDEQIKGAGFLSGGEPLIHPARMAPNSERPRTPMQKSPAAGPGSWPVPEDSLPAAMASDPPASSRVSPGDNTFAGVSGVRVRKTGEVDVTSTRAGSTTIVIPKKQVPIAASLWLKLRQLHPQLTQEQLQDEFYVELERMFAIPSPHGQAAAGDDRILSDEVKEAKAADADA